MRYAGFPNRIAGLMNGGKFAFTKSFKELVYTLPDSLD